MKPIVLTILDGWGIHAPSQTNAISLAKIPNIKGLEERYPFCSLQSSGIIVGLPWQEAGNSEVGHLIIGSGRIIYQDLPRISIEIKNGKFFENPALLKMLSQVKENNSTLHLMGLISSGNVHSYREHIYALIDFAGKNNIGKLRLHLFADGRDAPLKEAAKIISELSQKLEKPDWKIATIIGRYYAMNRNQNWDRTEIAYNLIALGRGEKISDPINKLQNLYQEGITDANIKPMTIVDENQQPIGPMKEGDAIVFFNFRQDSARQLTEAFVQPDFDKFPRQKINNLIFCAMTEYEKGLPIEIAYPPIKIEKLLVEVLNDAGKKILKTAETEKYAHVTYFFNGGREQPYPNETRKLIPSKIVSHYDENPEMRAEEISKSIIQGIKEKYDLIVANFANADMIGHTGNLKAAIKAAEYLDEAVKPLIKLAENGDCILIITADHGNIEEMISSQTGETKTEHSLNPVPFYLVGKEFKREKQSSRYSFDPSAGILADIAPTILDLMQIPQPSEMTGESLLKILR